MKRKLALLLIGIVMMTTVFVSCNKEESVDTSSTTATVKNEDLHFVVVPKCVHAWYDQVNMGAQDQAELLSAKLGCKVTIDYRAPQTADVAAQNTVLEQAAATHPDGIALAPLDYEGNKAVIDEIEAQGIPVILFDATAPSDSTLCSVGNDFTEQGTLAANKLAEMLNGQGKVAIMQGCPTAPNHVERYEAMQAALAQYPGITVIDGGIDNDSFETAQTQAAAVLAANPDLKGYLNVDATAKGLAAALEESGKTDQVKTVVMANLIEILNCIKDGTIDASYATQAQMQGSMVTLMLWQRTAGQNIPKKTDCGIVYIDSSNVDEWISIVNAE